MYIIVCKCPMCKDCCGEGYIQSLPLLGVSHFQGYAGEYATKEEAQNVILTYFGLDEQEHLSVREV